MEELTLLLHNVSLQVHLEDKWRWKVDSSLIYTVRSAYNSIIAQVSVDNVEATPSIWYKDVLLKVLLFVWRLFRDRLSTKNNLHRRHIFETLMINIVLVVVDRLKHPPIYFYIAFILVRFGIIYYDGLGLSRRCLMML